MSKGLAKAEEKRGFLVREAHVQKQLELLQQKYFEITTIKDVLVVQSAAEALAAMTRELEVHERYRNDAEAMIRRCEIRLGEITKNLPRRNGRRGDRTQSSKQEVLRAAHVEAGRVSKAERLASLPKQMQDRIVEGTSSVHEMYLEAGLAKRWTHPSWSFVDAVLAELENRRLKPRDPVLDALQERRSKMAARQGRLRTTAVLDYVREHGPSSATQIANAVGDTRRDISGTIATLARRGDLVRKRHGDVCLYALGETR